MENINVILFDRIKDYDLNKQLKQFNLGPLVEIKTENNNDFSIRTTGVIIKSSIKETQEKYNIKYGYIVPNTKNLYKIQDHIYTFLLGNDNKYHIVNEPIKILMEKKKREEVFNVIFVNEVDHKLPFDIYKVSEVGDNLFSIKPCLYCFGKLRNYEIDNASKEALVYKVENDLKVYNLYKNHITTFNKVPNSELYNSVDLQIEESDKIYYKK